MNQSQKILILRDKSVKNRSFAGIKRVPISLEKVHPGTWSSKTFGVRVSCDTEEVDPSPEWKEYNEFNENLRKSTEKLDFKVCFDKLLTLKISKDSSFQLRDKIFKLGYDCCYVYDEKSKRRVLATNRKDLYNYQQQSMKDLMEAICDKKHIYVWIPHCGNEDHEEEHKGKSAREYDDCLAAVITLDFYSVQIFKNGEEQFVDKFDNIECGFLKYYFRPSFDKEIGAVRVRMYRRIDESMWQNERNPDRTYLFCNYEYIGDYTYYDINVFISISTICNDQIKFEEHDFYHNVSVPGFVNTIKQNPDACLKMQENNIIGQEFLSQPTKELYDAKKDILTGVIGTYEWMEQNRYPKSSKIITKNDFYCPILINPWNIDKIYSYGINIYYGIGLDKNDNLIIDNVTRDKCLNLNSLKDSNNARHIRLLLQNGSKPLEVIKFGLVRRENKIDNDGNVYYNLGKYGTNSFPCIISKEDGGSFSRMTIDCYNEKCRSPYRKYYYSKVDEIVTKHQIALLQLQEFLGFDASQSIYGEKTEQLENVAEEEDLEDDSDEIENEFSQSTSKKRIRLSTDMIPITRTEVIMCVKYQPELDPYDSEFAWRTIMVVFLEDEIVMNTYRVYNVFKILHDYRDRPLSGELTILEQHADKYFRCTNGEATSSNTAAQLLEFIRQGKKGRIMYYTYFLTYRAMLLENEQKATVLNLLNTIIQKWNTMITSTRNIRIINNKANTNQTNVYAITCFNKYFKDLFDSFKRLANIMFNKELITVETFYDGNSSKNHISLFETYISTEAFDFAMVPETDEVIMKGIADKAFEDILKSKSDFEFHKLFGDYFDERIQNDYDILRKNVSDKKRKESISTFTEQFEFLISNISTLNAEEQFSQANGYDNRVKRTINELKNYVVSALHN